MLPRIVPSQSRRIVARCTFALVAGVTIARSARADLLQVDVSGGGSFATIQAAVDAAHDGDVILVRSGSYGAVTIDGKSVRLIADVNAQVSIAGTLTVKNIPAAKSVVVAGIGVVGGMQYPTSLPALALSNDLGCVRFQSCVLHGGTGVTGGGCNPGGVGGAGAAIASSSRVSFSACQLFGGDGYGDTFVACLGGLGGSGGTMSASSVALYDCVVRAGNGGGVDSQVNYHGGQGGEAWLVNDQLLFASRTHFVGGSGGSGFFGGSGGDGLSVQTGASVELVSCTFAGGNGVSGDGGSDGSDGSGQSGAGSSHTFANSARVFSAPWLVADTSALSVTVFGQPGDRVWIASGEPAHHFAPAYAGVRLETWPVWLAVTPLGTMPSSGAMTVTMTLPLDSPAAAATTYVLQGFIIDAEGHTLLGSPMHTTVLRCAVLAPDCNGNGVYDGCDILTASSADCDANAVPDDCEADCNGNGVADACDIANGTSVDLNHDAIPDECQPQNVTRYVDASAPAGGDGSAAHPFRTIAEGLAPSVSGDTVIVEDGVYVGAQNIGLGFGGRDITLRSANGAANCVIDCQHANTFLTIQQGESSASSIEGFTIRNGETQSFGGGIRVSSADTNVRDCIFMGCVASHGGGLDMSNSHGEVSGCVFVGNSATTVGGGMSCGGGAARVHDCLFQCNTAPTGGGFYLSNGYPFAKVVSRCRFFGNHATTSGGAIAIADDLPHNPIVPRFDHCLIADNSAPTGAAVRCTGTTSAFLDSTLVDNSASSTSAIYCQANADLTLRNTIVWHNTSPDGRTATIANSNGKLTVGYCDFDGGQGAVFVTPGANLVWQAGNIAANPRFADADGPDNDPSTWQDNDYHLSSASPCIDAGDNTAVPSDFFDVDLDGDVLEPTPLDLDGGPRFLDVATVPNTGNGTAPIVDIGTYERAR
jgi:predicted outer membrane repeat protein